MQVFQERSLIYLNSFVRHCKQVINAINTMYSLLHVFDHVQKICSFHHISCSLNTLICTVRKFVYWRNVFEFFYKPMYADYLLNIQKSFKKYLIMTQMQNSKFVICAMVCFRVMLVKGRQTLIQTIIRKFNFRI